MAVSRNTVSAVLILAAAGALVILLAIKWSKGQKETFIEHFYDEKEYAMRQAVMNTFDTSIKRKATPKEIEKYSSEHNNIEDAVAAIKKDFHVEEFKEDGQSYTMTEEAAFLVAEEEAAKPPAHPVFQLMDEVPVKEPLIPESPLIPNVRSISAQKKPPIAEAFHEDKVSFGRAELQKYVNEMRVFLNYLEARTA